MARLSAPVKWAIGIAAGLLALAGVLMVGFLLLVYVLNPVADEYARKTGLAPA